LEFAQGDFVLLPDFYPKYRQCVNALRERAGRCQAEVNPSARLLEAIEHRAATTFDLQMTILAYRLTHRGHCEWMAQMRKILELPGEPTEEQVDLADVLYTERDEVAAKGADLILYLSRNSLSRDDVTE
jgi:hypothetical protein